MIAIVLPLALVVGLSPLPILPAVVLLMTPRARGNARAYLGAWLLTLTSLVLLAVWLGSLADPEPPSEEGVGWIQVGTGVVFLVMAVVKWAKRPRAGQPKPPPQWLVALDSYTPARSARLGALLGANPKNLIMSLAAGAEIALLTVGWGSTLVGVVGFVVIASLGVATPIVAHAVLGDRATPALRRGRAWLEANSTALSVGVLVLLATLLLLKGLPTAL